MSIWMDSSISGETNTLANEVWRRFAWSKGEMRTRRCTPISLVSSPKAYSPFTVNVADLIPASSPAWLSFQDDLKAFTLRPSKIHSHEHFSPILRLGAAGSWMDGYDRVPCIVFAGE